MKKQIKKKKRETLPKLLAESLFVAAALSAAFGCAYYDCLQRSIHTQSENMLEERRMTRQ